MTDSISIYEKYNIDHNRLSRDYLKFPLRKGKRGVSSEIPPREDIEYLYLELNLTQKEISSILNISDVSFRDLILKKYNITKSKELNIKAQEKTMLRKYDRTNYFKGEEGKKAVDLANIQKYGVKRASQLPEIKEKYKQTCLERYDVTNVMKKPEFQEKNHIAQLKTKSTPEHHQKMISLWSMKTKEQQVTIKEKMRDTCLKKYGVTNIFKDTKYIKEKFQNKYPNTWAPYQAKYTNIKNFNEKYIKENFVVDGRFYIDKFKEYFNIKYTNTINKIYKKYFNIIEENFYTNQRETQELKWINSINNKLIRGYTIKHKNKKFKPDGYDPETRTIYEYLGDFYHGNPEVFNLNDINEKCYKTFGELYNETFERFDIIKSLGYKIIYMWEHDFIKNDKILENWKDKMREY